MSSTCSPSLLSLCPMFAKCSKCWAKVDALIYQINCPNPYRRFADTANRTSVMTLARRGIPMTWGELSRVLPLMRPWQHPVAPYAIGG
jgi:hypothetical protein